MQCKRVSLNCFCWNRSIELHCMQCFCSNDSLIVTFYLIQNVSKSCLTIKIICLAGITMDDFIIRFINSSITIQAAMKISSGWNFSLSAKQEIRFCLNKMYLLHNIWNDKKKRKPIWNEKIIRLLAFFLVDLLTYIFFSILVWC